MAGGTVRGWHDADMKGLLLGVGAGAGGRVSAIVFDVWVQVVGVPYKFTIEFRCRISDVLAGI